MPQTTGVQESTEVMGNTNTPEDDSQEALESAQFRDNTDTSYDDNQEYVGHGEWIQVEQDEAPSQEGVALKAQPQWIQQWLKDNDLDIKLNEDVLRRGYPNRWGAQIEVKSAWNVDLFASLLQDYKDKEVVEWIRYGWPTGQATPTTGPYTQW